METITITLHAADADRLYAAVGRQIAKGDVQAVEGQSQFATALATALKGNDAGTHDASKPATQHTFEKARPGGR